MRNASDIFCLKEPKDGDTSGTQMFSVNGQCHLAKLSRRRHMHAGSSSFEYGSTPKFDNENDAEDAAVSYQSPSEEAEDRRYRQSATDREGGLADVKEELEELQLESADGESAGSSPKKRTSPKKKKSPSFRRLNAKAEEQQQQQQVTESAMARNPLTGAGVETEVHRKSKRGPPRVPKWSW